MKRILLAFAAMMLACVETVEAGDGVYFKRDNVLVPTVATDISAVKETLTVTIGRDGFARVDLYCEYANGGNPKTVTMAFEADSQCGDRKQMNRMGTPQHVEDFTATVNGERLRCSNSMVAMAEGKTRHNPGVDSMAVFAHAYSFEAPFKRGLNVVRHTYKYRMGGKNSENFTIPYRLTSASGWANGKVGDFTLRITAEDAMVGLCLVDTLFKAAPFTAAKGSRIFYMKSDRYGNFLYSCMSEGDTIVWHSRDFCPTADISIDSPWWETLPQTATSAKVVIDSNGNEARYIADCGDSYFISVQDFVFVKKAGSRIVEYDARKGKGCIYIAGDGARRVNVRRAPSTDSPVVCRISDSGEYVPEVYPCLGMVAGDDGHEWYKTKVNGKTGYIRQDLMQWDAINTF